MPTLPIPIFGSLVLGFLLVRMWITDRRHGALAALLALCAVQGVIISMAQHYQVPGMQRLQPITATLIPPMAWVAFQITAVRRFKPIDLVHLAAPGAAIISILAFPPVLDLLIPGLFLGYGVALVWQGALGSDALPRLRLDEGDLPRQIWQIIGATLIGSAFSDVIIIAAHLGGADYLRPWIISIYSSAMLVLTGSLSLSRALDSTPEEAEPVLDQEVHQQDAELMARLDALMKSQKPYLNPDLTLSQLARKLSVPVKPLSAAINRSTGGNVSRYINAQRVKMAQIRLLAGDSVTTAMFDAGFNTKSNFNRAFLHVTGQNPTDWLKAQG